MVKRRVYRKRGYNKRKAMRKQMRKYRKINPKSTHLPLGQSQKVTHKYLENTFVSTTIGNTGVYTFQINGMYDPNITGVGHQPLGFDQLGAIFGRYCVIGASIKCRAWNRSSKNLGIALYISEFTNPVPALGGMVGVIEQGGITYRILGGVGNDHSNVVPKMLTTKVSMKKFCRVSSILDDDTLSATTSTNPSRPVYCHVCVWNVDGDLTSDTVAIYFELQQTAVWTRPYNLSQS